MSYPDEDYNPLTVNVGDMTVVDVHTTFTESAVIEDTIYRKGITINGASVIVNATNCWFYRADPANPPQPIRSQNGGTFVGTKIKIGYDGTTVPGFDPIGGVYDPADYQCRTFTSENGPFYISEYLFTHIEEGPTLQEEQVRLDYGVVGPFVILDEDAHSDVFQSTGFCDAAIQRTRWRAEHAPGSLDHKSIRGFQGESSIGDWVSLTILDSYVTWIGSSAFNIDDSGGFDIPEIVFKHLVFDADSGSEVFNAELPALITERCDNRWTTGGLISGDQLCGGGSVTAVSVGTPGTNAGTTTCALTLPAAATVGMMIIVDLFAEDNQAVPGTTDWVPPAADDWVLVGNSAGTLSSHDYATFRRPVKVGDTAGVTSFTFTATTGAPVIGAIDLLDDLDLTSPFGGFVQIEEGTQVNPATHPGITTVAANTMVRVVLSSREGVAGWVATTPAVQDERYDTGSGRRLAAFTFTQAAAGATGGLAYTMPAIQRYGAGAFYVTSAPVAPDAPTNPSATADSQTQITVDWDNVTGETGYRVERSLTGVGAWSDVSGNLPANTVTYADTGLTCNTQYFYRVFAFNGVGDSPASSTVNATTNACAGGGGNRIGGTGAIRKPPRRTSAR